MAFILPMAEGSHHTRFGYTPVDTASGIRDG